MNNEKFQPDQLDKLRIRRNFNRAAQNYDQAAIVQREIAQRLLERLDYIHCDPISVLDVGAGTGYCTQQLMKRFKQANVFALDIAQNMLSIAASKRTLIEKTIKKRSFYVCGDVDALPLLDNSVDLIISNLTLQWCNDLQIPFSEFMRVLKPGGLLLFSSFGPDTLIELKQSWLSVDSAAHVHHFIDMHDVGDLLLHTFFENPVTDAERIYMHYQTVCDLLRDLKLIGATNATHIQRKGLTIQSKLSSMIKAYEHYREKGVLPATYEVVYGHAWKPSAKPNEVNVQFCNPHIR